MPGLPAPLGTRSLRTHPFAPYGRQRPGETPLRTALSPRYLIRPPWPWAATRDENRACPAKLGSPWCGRARCYPGDFVSALSPRYLIRPPWPWAATRDENRACPAKLGSPWCGRARCYPGDFVSG